MSSAALRWLCVAVLVAAVSGAAADPQLRQLVKMLATRLDTLERDRAEDRERVARLEGRLTTDPGRVTEGVARMRAELRQLSDHIRTQATVTESLQEMRSEIDGISDEIRRLKEATESSAARAAHSSDADSSQQTVISWLKDMVTMLKGQVADLAEGFNVTQLLQLQQSAASRATLLETDVRSLEDSVQTLRAHRRADGTQLGQLKTDLTELLAKAQDRENTYAHLMDEVSTLRKELLFAPAHNTTEPTDEPATWRPHHSRRRHHRRHRGHSGRGPFQLRAVEQILDVVYRRQQELDSELQAARRNVSTLQQWRTAAEQRQEELLERTERADRERQQLQWQLNVTSCRDSVREVQQSTTRLIQEVEQLETKVDGQLVEVRRDLAQLQVGYGTLQTAVRAVGDEQKQLPALSRQMKQKMAELSERQDLDRTSLLELQTDLLTLALDRPSSDGQHKVAR
ncbi:rho-associated protein kinase 2-like [Amphibalanus amphitrite]|uniref:rho-associated protein kinase 2-like n=1 Tax=Amphibalanus amphitrite TaxID=1232801 RepID=UPI001C8FCCE4|nr:rho-associated protein kinase 2-like [Amphibalanus amphitrite]